MLADTHRAWAVAWWLGETLTIDAAAVALDRAPAVHPAVVLAGAAIAPVFSAGRWLSPDMDHRWWPGPPRHGYQWRGHRGITHRPWLATVVTLVFGVVPYLIAVRAGVPTPVAPLAFSPAAGWWSHLSGDMIYGRLPVHLPRLAWRMDEAGRWHRRWVWWRYIVGLGWKTGGVLERGGRWWRDPAAGVCGALSVVLVGAHLALFVNG
jgi:hypothetical protein